MSRAVGTRAAAHPHPPSARRVFLLWERPATGSRELTQRWIEGELSGIREIPEIHDAELISLGAPTERHTRSHDWLLMLRLSEHSRGDVVDAEPVLRDFIAELRSLGMNPTVLLEL